MSRSIGDDEEMEEERRLAYVGITRAEEQTVFNMRIIYGHCLVDRVIINPSRFINEISEEIIENASETETIEAVFIWQDISYDKRMLHTQFARAEPVL